MPFLHPRPVIFYKINLRSFKGSHIASFVPSTKSTEFRGTRLASVLFEIFNSPHPNRTSSKIQLRQKTLNCASLFITRSRPSKSWPISALVLSRTKWQEGRKACLRESHRSQTTASGTIQTPAPPHHARIYLVSYFPPNICQPKAYMYFFYFGLAHSWLYLHTQTGELFFDGSSGQASTLNVFLSCPSNVAILVIPKGRSGLPPHINFKGVRPV